MKRRTIHQPHPFGEINVTPLIDVVMVLIVFYLIVGKLAADQRSPVRLPPAAAGKDERPQDVLVINVLPGQPPGTTRLVVDSEPVAPGALEPLIRHRLAQKRSMVVQVRAQRELPYGAVEPVVSACRAAGVGTVRLATERGP